MAVIICPIRSVGHNDFSSNAKGQDGIHGIPGIPGKRGYRVGLEWNEHSNCLIVLLSVILTPLVTGCLQSQILNTSVFCICDWLKCFVLPFCAVSCVSQGICWSAVVFIMDGII